MALPVTPPQRHRVSLPEEPARRLATQSLLMVLATAVAAAIAGAVGTFLQLVVFDLSDQELLTEAGAWGYVASVCLLGLMLLPAAIGVGLGVRALRLGERRLATAGIVANAVAGTYLAVVVGVNLLLG